MQVTLPPNLKEVAAYYGWSRELNAGPDAGHPAPRLRRDLDPGLAHLLGLDPATPLDLETVANLLAGNRSDGRPIPGKQVQSGERVTFIDLCWSADKSVSIAWALAPTPEEASVIALALEQASHETMAFAVTPQIGRARRGKAGSGGSEAGSIAWIAFDHWTSRPTPGSAGDAQLHVHCPILNIVRTADGHVGGLDLQRLKGRVHELGAIFQANLARNLRRAGIAVAFDPQHGCARIPAIPDDARSTFAKRTTIGTAAAYAHADKLGLDWDELDERSRITLLKQAVQGDPRGAKRDDLGDRASWQAEAASLGYRHLSVLGTEPKRPIPTRDERLERAYAVAVDLLEPKLESAAVLPESQVRLAAARSLIAAGIEAVDDVEGVLELIHTRGVRQEGRVVTLLPEAPSADGEGTCWQRAVRSYTTGLHLEREGELIDLVREAASEHYAALSAEAVTAAVSRSGRDFSGTVHGRTQREALDRLGTGAAFTAVIGVAGSGKTTLLQPLVDAYTAAGSQVFGTSLGWKQTRALTETGIPAERCLALAKLLSDAERGKINLGPDTVIIIDELGQVGTRDLLRLMRLRRVNGQFRILAVGDPRQCSSVAAGPVIDLLQEALGRDAIPEILTTVRQREQDERETTGMFRQGRAAEALRRKRSDGTARLVPGSPAAVAEVVADLWTVLRAEHADDPAYSLSVSTPTNADALMLASAIRERRRTAGELTGPDHLIQATDNVGRKFEVALAVGDRVRLFARTSARSKSGQTLEIGVNGSVLEIETIAPGGIRLRDAAGRSGMVAWATLLHPDGDPAEPRYRLGYGDVLTIDSIQGVTSEESIFVMPNGSSAIDAFRGYTAASRHRARSFLICGETAERMSITSRRPIGDRRPVTEDEIWERVAANLSREPKVVTATALVSRAREVASDARRTLPLALAPLEACERRGLTRTSLQRGFMRNREIAVLTDWAETIAEPLARQVVDTTALADTLSGRGSKAGSQEATDGLEPAGFVRGRMLRRLEQWADEISEMLERHLAQTTSLVHDLSDPARDVVMRSGRLARSFAERRDLKLLDVWTHSLTEWLEIQNRAIRGVIKALSKNATSSLARPAIKQINQLTELPVNQIKIETSRKSPKRRIRGKDSGLDL